MKKGTKNSRKSIPIKTQLRLWVKAGGRCELNGCNEYLLRDNLTLSETNYSDVAHIVAASRNGPRGDDPLPLSQRNKISNLMLVCKKHHHLLDDNDYVKTYPKHRLQHFKKEHEDRILKLTKIRPANKTSILRFKANIGKDVVHVPTDQIQRAVYPKYPVDENGIEIDLTSIKGDDKSYWKVGADCITQRVSELLTSRIDSPSPSHISVFAFGSIPLLVHLGSCLGNKADIDIFQRHRGPISWTWKRKTKAAKYEFYRIKKGKDLTRVVVVLSLSGRINLGDLPNVVNEKYFVYEITITDQTPNPMYIKSRHTA